jgi:hypothetical protein
MPAGKYTLLIEQGATLNLSLAYKDSANAAVDLTGYSGKMQIRSGYADSNPTTYLTLSSSLQADGTGLTFGGGNEYSTFYEITSTSVIRIFSTKLGGGNLGYDGVFSQATLDIKIY